MVAVDRHCSLTQSLRPLGFLLSSASFDWLGRLESSVNLYMTGYITVKVGSQAHAHTHTNTESSLNAHTHTQSPGPIWPRAGDGDCELYCPNTAGGVCVCASMWEIRQTYTGGRWKKSGGWALISSRVEADGLVQDNFRSALRIKAVWHRPRFVFSTTQKHKETAEAFKMSKF